MLYSAGSGRDPEINLDKGQFHVIADSILFETDNASITVDELLKKVSARYLLLCFDQSIGRHVLFLSVSTH